MADKKVVVSFDPPAVLEWQFNPMEVRMRKKGKIKFVRDPKSPKWVFVSFNPLPPDWSQSVGPTGSTLTVTDPMRPPTGVFKYTITVLFRNKYYTSPEHTIRDDGPPIIMNET